MTKFQKLTNKEKIEHIWEYYRYYILGSIIGIYAIYSMAMSIFGPKPPEPLVNVVIMGLYREDRDQIDEFKKGMEELFIQDEDEEGKVGLNMFQVDWDAATPMDVAMEQKLVLMFQAREMDVMIIQESKFNSFLANVEEAMYEPLEGQPELMSLLDENPDKLVMKKLPGDSKEKIYGIHTKDNKKLQALGIGEGYIISIPIVSENKDNAFKIVKWLLE